MPRGKYKKQPVKADPLYGSNEVTKLINYIMVDGKKTVAQHIAAEQYMRTHGRPLEQHLRPKRRVPPCKAKPYDEEH